MSKFKRVNLLFCLIFSFIFLFGSVFSVQAAAAFTKKNCVMQQCIDQKDYPNEIVECVVDYTTQSIRNNGNREIIWSIDNMKFQIAEYPWYMWDNLYRFSNARVEISKNRDSVLIHVCVYRKSGILFQENGYDLTFKCKVN